MDILKSVLVIVPCCGKGYAQGVKLLNELNLNGLPYNLAQAAPRHCKSIIDKFCIAEDLAKKIPFIFIEDICFKAEKVNDPIFVKELIDQLLKVKAGQLCNNSLN